MCRLQSKSLFKSDENNRDLIEKHFGRFFATMPHEFVFMPGDKRLIMKLVEHVNNVIDREGYTFFGKPTVNAEDSLHNIMAKLNSGRCPQGYRYGDEIKQFAVYVRMIAGPLAYQTIQNNLRGAMPSLQSTNRYIQKTHTFISEGILRSNELYLYLKERNLPLVVSISEDATRIVGRTQYDRKSNQIIGFTLRINRTSGLPIPFSYPARNVKDFCRHFTEPNSVSSSVNIVVAQPLCNAPPFPLLVYGFDNKHTVAEVLNRFETITSELKSLNITILSISTDSEPRYNTAMRIKSRLGNGSEIFNAEWFSCDPFIDYPVFVQDTMHIGTKLRNFLLHTLWNLFKLKFGKYFITLNHLRVLM